MPVGLSSRIALRHTRGADWPHRSSLGGDVESRSNEVQALEQDWARNARWEGVKRGYSAEDVVRLRGSLRAEHTLAKRGAEKLWTLTRERPFVNSLGALTGNQAVQQVKARGPAIYLSRLQGAAPAHDSGPE